KEVHDDAGYASAALGYEITLAPHATSAVGVVVPLSGAVVRPDLGDLTPAAWIERERAATAASWRERLDRVSIRVPPAGEPLIATEVYRYTGDRALLERMWPHVSAAARYLETLRQSERTAANLTPDTRALYGLLPASISHEGYAAKPMHSYWDDFWGLKGYDS